MRVVITEKPSVARDLARVLGATARRDGWLQGQGLRITWCVGHLAELEEPAHYDTRWKRWSLDSLPIVPEGGFDVRLRPDAAERFRVIERLLNDPQTTSVINACDAGREGELIFRYVFDLAHCDRPVERLWLASLTERAIQDAWGRLRPDHELRPLLDAARCRAEADWLVGLNATRGMTCLARKGGGGGAVLSVGRVQTPTLAMLVVRDREIAAFVPEPTWQLRATFRAVATPGEGEAANPTDARWEATWFRPDSGPATPPGPTKPRSDDEAPPAERLPSGELANALAEAVRGQDGTIEQAETRRITDRPPLLYDLTSLQRRANQRYGLSAQRTLEVAQALYERHKLITYPRTDARHLTPDQVPELPGIASGLSEMSVYTPHARAVVARFEQGFVPNRRVVDAGEVGDHHAILPTGTPATGRNLTPDEKRVFDLVARRFLAALSPDALFDRTTLVVAVHVPAPEGLPSPPRFRARGRVCLQEGWRAVDPPKSKKEVDLPRVTAGETAHTEQTEVLEGETRPPRAYNDASILRAMETAGRHLDDAGLRRALRASGLGTPATRAAILQTLLDRGFAARQGRSLVATERGCALIDAIPSDELKSAELTGRWEARLAQMAEGRDDRDAFMRDVVAHLRTLIDAIATAPAANHPAFAGPKPDGKPLGACPRCGQDVVEGRPVYRCVACEFVIFKRMSGREISRRMAAALLKDGRTQSVKGFKSQRTGKAFSAGLHIDGEGKVGLWFPERASVGPCPRCDGGTVQVRGKVYGCTTEGCDVHVFRTMSGRDITEGECRVLLSRGRTEMLEGFTSRRTGNAFSAGLALDETGKAVMWFADQGPPGSDGAQQPPASDAPPTPVPMPAQAAEQDTPTDPAGMTCPECSQGSILRGRTAWGCSRWREGCRWTLRYDSVSGPDEAVAAVRDLQQR